MKNINQIIKILNKKGFKVVHGNGSLVKLYPINNGPYYSLHLGEKAIHPLKRFAKKNWNIDIATL